MNANEVKEILIKNGVFNLFHANTVVTSLTFINNGGLLSRGNVEKNNLAQTSQQSDDKDKQFGVFNDIFFDSVDIHERAKDLNNYGPVTFVYSVNLLNELSEYDICVTKENPIKWNEEMGYSDKYFIDYNELFSEFYKGDFNQHITIRNIDKPVSFKYLEKIIIDNPGDDLKRYLTNAYEEIDKTLKENGISVPFLIRECTDECLCKDKYNGFKEGFTYHKFKTKL